MDKRLAPPYMGNVILKDVQMKDIIRSIAIGDFVKFICQSGDIYFGFVWDVFNWGNRPVLRIVAPQIGGIGVTPAQLPSLCTGIPSSVKVWSVGITDVCHLLPMTKKEVLDWMTPSLTPDWLIQLDDSATLASGPLTINPKKDESRRVGGHMPGIDGERVSKDAWDAFKETL